jgi:hypothetical protein
MESIENLMACEHSIGVWKVSSRGSAHSPRVPKHVRIRFIALYGQGVGGFGGAGLANLAASIGAFGCS